ncbi:MAG: Xaa-Pro peptidase family protein [Bacillota bacterium]|nr:Xaa-Pro peptidase family protein [Bacillota bacterium]
MDFRAKLERLYAAMVNNDLDALVYGTGANFQYFTGLPVTWRRMEEPAVPDCLLVLARDRSPRVVAAASCGMSCAERTAAAAVAVAFAEAVTFETVESRDGILRLLRGLVKGKRVGTGLQAEKYLSGLIKEALPDVECINAEALGEALRLQKDGEEIAVLRRAAALTGRVMEIVVGSIRPGITQPELRAKVQQAGLALGAQDVSFSPAALFVKSGTAPTEDPFVYPLDKGLLPGTSIAFDFGFLLDGYCSDFGRSFYCGSAPAHIAGAYRALQESLCSLVGQMKPGQMTLGELFGVMEAEMDRRGYGDRLRARLKDGTLGHQIGVDLHENPWIRPGCDVVLQPGMVMALEPKAWLPGEYYLRVEDIVLITDDGAEFLTSFDRQLFELPV